MRESFVIHSEYIEDLPDGYKERFLQMVYNYGIHEEVPTLEGLELSLWIKIQRRIDLDRESYETRKQKLKEYKENWKKKNHSESLGIIENHSESFGIIPTNTSSVSVNDTVSVNDIDTDIVFDIDNDIEIDTDIDTVSESMPTKSTPSQVAYSKELFNLFKDAGLPCARNNEISFMQTDFKNAMDYLRKTSEFQHIHSDDVIGAVKNYIQVYTDSNSYVSTKMNFFSLVKSKMFYNLLPSNFDADNFKKFGAETVDNKKEPDNYINYDKQYRECPNCHKTKLWLYPKSKKGYFCDYCFKEFTPEEVTT